MPTLKVSSTEELIAAVPHLIGFEVEESLVVIPLAHGPAVIRIDLPRTPQQQAAMADTLVPPMQRHGSTDVILIGFSSNSRHVDAVSSQLRDALAIHEIDVHARIWAGEERWTELDSGNSGLRSTPATERFRAQVALDGRRMPATSRDAVARSLVGDPEPVRREVETMAEAMLTSSPSRERRWAHERAQTFAADGNALSDKDAARMLLALRLEGTIRDQMMAKLTRATAVTWQPLWEDLTRRAPEDLLAPAASLAALTSWVSGDGARAWCALDRIPPGEQTNLARLVSVVLEKGVDPKDWDKAVVADTLPAEILPERSNGRRPLEPPALGAERPPASPPR